MSVRFAALLALVLVIAAPATSLAASGEGAGAQTGILTLVQVAAALVVFAVILAAARHARARMSAREQVWLPPSWTDEGDLR